MNTDVHAMLTLEPCQLKRGVEPILQVKELEKYTNVNDSVDIVQNDAHSAF